MHDVSATNLESLERASGPFRSNHILPESGAAGRFLFWSGAPTATSLVFPLPALASK